MNKKLEIAQNTIEEANLIYSHDSDPGISRKLINNEFHYFYFDGKEVQEKSVLERIKHLIIPPAWQNVWICKDKNGHLQATGIDNKNRKQYRYHKRWSKVRDENKYNRVIQFSNALPKIRKQIDSDMNLPGMPKDKIIATVVKLLEKTLIRVGNEEYVKQNNSYGLTTLHDKHVKIDDEEVIFMFKGKSGVKHKIVLDDKRIAKIVQKSKDIPGYELFQYIEKDGSHNSITSTDVNQYLKNISGEDFTAKDFRTWAGTVLAANALKEFKAFDSEAEAKRNIVHAIESVSKKLGNTKSICRKCYIHPEVLNSYLDGSFIKYVSQELKENYVKNLKDLKPEEAMVVAFLEEKMQKANS